MKIRYILILCIIPISILPLSAEKFVFKYNKGEKYKIITEVSQSTYVNGSFNNNTYILEKEAVNVVSTKGESAELLCSYQTSEKFTGVNTSFILKQDYISQFLKDQYGVYNINADYFMPVKRNIPFFPDRDVKIGDTWTGDAEEVHDFRRYYGITKAFHFPIKVHYTYQSRDTYMDNKKIAVFKIHYTTFHEVKTSGDIIQIIPVKITGKSEQLYYWDISGGKLHSYVESFTYIFHLSNGKIVEFKGKAIGKLIPSPYLDKDLIAHELKKEIEKQGITDTTVRKDEKGITLSLENIQFEPYSFELIESEKKKLARIGEILKRFQSRDFLITGHTAQVGPEETSQILSVNRAKAVGDYLLTLGSCKESQITIAGKGSKNPIADNKTEQGKKRNRRVEITILEN